MEEEKQTLQVRPQSATEEVELELPCSCTGLLRKKSCAEHGKQAEADETQFKRLQDAQRAQLRERIIRNMKAHSRGEVAKSNGWARLSPYYNDGVSDDFFYKGFDGVSFDQAIRAD